MAESRLRPRHLTLLLCLLVAQPAWAEWVWVTSSSEGSHTYVDPTTLRVSGKTRRMWELVDLNKPDKDGDLSYRFYREYDCAEERTRSLQGSYFTENAGGGTRTGGFSTPADWAYIEPGSVGATKLKVVCGMKP
jgi:hypothetical protein